MASIQTAYEWAIEKCNAPNIGYSQANRMEKTCLLYTSPSPRDN